MSAGQTLSNGPLLELFTSSLGVSHNSASKTALAVRLLAPVDQDQLRIYDISVDAAAKARFRAKNAGHLELPLLLVNGTRIGSIDDLQEAVDDDRLFDFLRLSNPPSRPSVDDDLADELDEGDVDALLETFDKGREGTGFRISGGLLTPPETPKQANTERLSTVEHFKQLPTTVVPPLSPPMTPEMATHGQFSTPSPVKAVIGLPASPRAIATRPSPVAARVKEAEEHALPPTPLRAASQESRKQHARNASTKSSGHKSKASSIADLCAAIDDVLVDVSGSDPAIPARASPSREMGDIPVPLKDFLNASPNFEGPVDAGWRRHTPQLMDLSGLSGPSVRPVEQAAKELGTTLVGPARVMPQPRLLDQHISDISDRGVDDQARRKRGGLFSCFSPKAAGREFND